MNENYYIGIDIGTTVSKGVIISHDGSIIKKAQILHQYVLGKDYAISWWDEIRNLITKLAEGVKPLSMIAISAMVPNLVFLDEVGSTIIPTRLFTDDFAEDIQAKLDQIDGTKWQNESLSKLIMIKRQYKQFSKVRHLLSTHNYIGFMLTGKYYCDYASACEYGKIYNQALKVWDSSVLEKYGIDANIFPDLVPSTRIVGNILPNVATELGLDKNVKVLAGAHDSVASMIGAGLRDKYDSLIYYGTFNSTARINASIEEIITGEFFSNPIIWTSSLPDTGPQITTLTKIFCGENDFDEMDRLASESCLGANGTVFVPAPRLLETSISSKADGCLYHIGNSTTKQDICRAIYEAFPYGIVLFWYSDSDYKKSANYYVAGGGARSDVRLKITSEILNHKLIKLECSENAIGTALLCIAAEDINRFAHIQSERHYKSRVYAPDNIINKEKIMECLSRYFACAGIAAFDLNKISAMLDI